MLSAGNPPAPHRETAPARALTACSLPGCGAGSRRSPGTLALDDMHPTVLLKLRSGAAPLVHTASPALSLLLQLRGGGSVAHAAPGAGLALASLLMKNMIGAGIFALFTALTSTNTGLLPGLAILAAVAAASTVSFELLGEATAMSSNGDVTTTELWQEAVGGGAWLIGAATFLQGFSCLVQFSATCTDLLVPFAPRVSRTMLTLAAGIALVPLCLANELSALRYSSAVGLVGVLYSVLFVCWRAADGSYAAGGRWHLATRVASPLLRCDWRSLEFVGIMNTACFAHLNVPAYWRAWRQLHPSTVAPKELLHGFRRVVRLSLSTTRWQWKSDHQVVRMMQEQRDTTRAPLFLILVDLGQTTRSF